MNNICLFEPFEKQKEFIEKVFDDRYKYLLYGGAIRGGKTFCALAIVILFCKFFPFSRYAVVRRDRRLLTKNTIPSFFKILPKNFLKSFNNTELVAKFSNGSEIYFLGENIDKDKDLDKFKGLEVNGFVLEECNELSENMFFKAIERSGSNFIDPMPPPKIILTCNPSQTWVKTRFYDKYIANKLEAPYFYLKSTIYDNPTVPEEYKENLKNLPSAIYKRFVDGSWEGSDDPFQLISWLNIHNAADIINNEDNSIIKRYLGVDVAGHGSDKTIFCMTENSNIVDFIEYSDTAVQEVAQKIIQLKHEYKIDERHIVVDGAGLGGGVIDLLKEQKINVYNFIGGAKALEEDTEYHYKNLKSQGFWKLRESFQNGDVGNLQNEKAKSDLSAIWYIVDAEKQIRIESKDETKKRIGRSPDFADALMYCNFARIYENIAPLPGVFIF